jgi:hypothetical protein
LGGLVESMLTIEFLVGSSCGSGAASLITLKSDDTEKLGLIIALLLLGITISLICCLGSDWFEFECSIGFLLLMLLFTTTAFSIYIYFLKNFKELFV